MSKDVLKLVDPENKFVAENYSMAWEIAKQTKDIEVVRAVANRIHNDMICEVFARITYEQHTKRLFDLNELLWIMLESSAVVTCVYGSQDRIVESFLNGGYYKISARCRSDFDEPEEDFCSGCKVYKNDSLMSTRILDDKVTAEDIFDFLFWQREILDNNGEVIEIL